LIQHVRVDHCGAHVAVAEQFLDRSDVIAGFEQMRRERVTKRVARSGPRDSSRTGGILHGALQDGFMQVMPATLAGLFVSVEPRGPPRAASSRVPGDHHRAHDRQTNRTLGAHDAVHPRQAPADHRFIEEQDGAQRLVLGRRPDATRGETQTNGDTWRSDLRRNQIEIGLTKSAYVNRWAANYFLISFSSAAKSVFASASVSRIVVVGADRVPVRAPDPTNAVMRPPSR
jgi:hypothetical protein